MGETEWGEEQRLKGFGTSPWNVKTLHEVSAVIYQEAARKAAGEEAEKGKEKKAEEKKEEGEYVDVEYDIKDEDKE